MTLHHTPETAVVNVANPSIHGVAHDSTPHLIERSQALPQTTPVTLAQLLSEGLALPPARNLPETPDTPEPSRSRRHGQALRLVDTRALDRLAWLEIRRSGLGSSDAAAAVGLNPYKSQLELWMEKTGRTVSPASTDAPQGQDTLDSPLYWGTVLEPLVAEQYARHTGHRVRRVNAILQHPDPQYSWMLANLDREVVGQPDVQILECKTAGLHGARLWKDGVPEYVQLQVMHQLAVTGQQAADVAVLLGGHQLEIHRIERNEALIERLIELEQAFWWHVESDTPPLADASESAERALRCLYPEDNGQTCDFSQDDTLSGQFSALQQVRQQLDELKTREAQLKHRLQEAMGEATRAVFASGSVTWKKARDSESVDLKRLLQDHPHLKAAYTVSKPGSRRFLIA